MKKIIALLVLCISIMSCSKKTDETFAYNFEENAQLNIETREGIYMKFSSITEGADVVFSYEYNAADDVNTADDEYSEYIRFQIDPSTIEFSFSDDELQDINAVYSESCFCDFSNNGEKNVPPKGTISGKKISETEWDITIDVTFYGDEQKSVSSIFRQKK